MSKILIDAGSSVNIFYVGALDRMDTPEMARGMINPQTRSCLYRFDSNVTRSPDMVSLLVRADPYNIMRFYVIDVESSHNVVLGGLGST